HLHTELDSLRRGALKDLYVAEQQYAYARTTPRSSVVVVINNDAKPAGFAFHVDGLGLDNARLRDQLGTLKSDVLVNNGVLALAMPPRSAVVLTEQPNYSHVLY